MGASGAAAVTSMIISVVASGGTVGGSVKVAFVVASVIVEGLFSVSGRVALSNTKSMLGTSTLGISIGAGGGGTVYTRFFSGIGSVASSKSKSSKGTSCATGSLVGSAGIDSGMSPVVDMKVVLSLVGSENAVIV